MKHWFVFAICTCAILWTAAQAFAATGAICPTTVNGQTNVVTCSGNACVSNGHNGICQLATFPSTMYNAWGMAVYKWDATTSKWVPDGTFTTGNVDKCACHYTIVIDGQTYGVDATNICCDAASDPAKPGKVIKWGICDHPNCDPLHPNCTITGTRTAAEGECKN